MLTSSTEGGVTDFNDFIDYVAVTDSNSDCNAAFDVASISTSEKVGVRNAALQITTLVSVLKSFQRELLNIKLLNTLYNNLV